MSRHDGQIPLNGSLGEFTNFFYMPDRPSGTGAVISTFYSALRPEGLHVALRRKTAISFGDGVRDAPGHRRRFRSAHALAGRRTLPEVPRAFLDRARRADQPAFRADVLSLPGACGDIEYGKDTPSFKNLGYLRSTHDRQDQQPLGQLSQRLWLFVEWTTSAQVPVEDLARHAASLPLCKLSFRMTHTAQEPRTGRSPEYLSWSSTSVPDHANCSISNRSTQATRCSLIATLEYLGQRYDLEVSDDHVIDDHG